MKAGADSNGNLLAGTASTVLFAGRPGSLSGRIMLSNATPEAIVHQPLLRTHLGSRAKSGAKGASSDIAISMPPVVAQPLASRQVPISLSLDQFTPPGTYKGELELGGEKRDVVVQVQEDWNFNMEPDEIVITGHAGEKIQRQVVFTNDGNVPLTVKSLVSVTLNEDRAHFRALRAALSDVGADLKAIEDFAAAYARHFEAVFEKFALKIQNDKTTIAPGETRAIEFNISVPEKLSPRRRYQGAAVIVTEDLSFVVVPD